MYEKKYRDTKISPESDSHEESDTEDSYEFEITSQQLSQELQVEGFENKTIKEKTTQNNCWST